MARETPALHPQNRDFRWRSCAGAVRLRREQVRHFDEHGFLLYERAFDAAALEAAIAEIDPFEAKAEAFLREHGGRLHIARAGEITFSVHLVRQSRVLRAMSAAPEVLALCHDLVGPDVRLYWDQAVYKKPGTQAEFPWHQDNGYTFIEPQQYLTCWVALTDTDEHDGCPWVVPGLHRRGTLAHVWTELGWRCLDGEPEGAVAVPAKAGDVVVFSSLTPHRTGPNRSDRVRKAYILQYAPAGARTLPTDGRPGGPQDAPDRQYEVLRGGIPVPPP